VFNGPLSRTTQLSRYQKVKTNVDLLQQETVSGCGISWAIYKSALRSRQITMPAPHHSVFLQARCPSCCPTNSVRALKTHTHTHTTVLLLFWNMSGTTWVCRYQKGKTRKVKTNLDLLELWIYWSKRHDIDKYSLICKKSTHNF